MYLSLNGCAFLAGGKAMARLRISLLGPFEVWLDGEPITSFHSDKVRALLAYLAVEAGRPHRRETLAGLLWPDYPDRSARTSLSNTLSHLRTALRDREADTPACSSSTRWCNSTPSQIIGRT
jgi:DNA-binding SARP family transcriptional activator